MAGATRYEKLKSLLREKIVSGKYERGDRFFSQNELMEKYGLSFSTVTRALDELARDGYLTRQRGKGTFISSTHSPVEDRKAAPLSVCIFAPWNPATSPLSSTALIYRHLEEARPEGFNLRFIPHGTEPDDLEPFLFVRGPVDAAVFLYPLESHIGAIRKMAEAFPVVILTDSADSFGSAAIQTNLYSVGKMATKHLCELGHRNIAVVGDGDGQFPTAELLAGHRAVLKEFEIPYRETLIRADASDSMSWPSLADVLELNADREITAVFALSSVACLGVLSELRAMNWHLPQDLSLVCFDNLDKALSSFPTITTVGFPAKALALQMLRRVEDVLQSSADADGTTIAPLLTVRASTAGC